MMRIPAKKWETREDLLRQIEFARNWIEQEPGRYSLEQIAALAAISPYHFQRLFRATYGRTPLQFLTECRLRRAMMLLEAGDLSIEGVCIEVGFASVSSFSKLFAKRFGITPGQVRRRAKERSRVVG